ncbi:MAG: carbamoyl-phosphate synthase large subunit, partial [Actinobacteria bacterium]|nr:carbamoyl-phosphate synthase large subunit [Actinomycetota bacterium]
GRTFSEALCKGLRSLERDVDLFGPAARSESLESIAATLERPLEHRLHTLTSALRSGMDPDEAARRSTIDPWFVDQIAALASHHSRLSSLGSLADLDRATLRAAKRMGFSDGQLAEAVDCGEAELRARRIALDIVPTYKTVDTCAGEFEAHTPYYYSTYEDEDEVRAGVRPKVVILGSGPNRIGQGIEFDYCCVHAAFALRAAGFETVMVNCNPETVSTDYDTSDRLYLEPLTFEDVMNVIERERPFGVIVQLGGQTPLALAGALQGAGARILGTSPDAIDRAEDRERFGAVLADLRLPHPPNGIARSAGEATAVADTIGYPVLVRPSYVLGGRAMEIVYERFSLERYMKDATRVSANHPVLIDRFLEGAVEVDCDVLYDGTDLYVGGVLEHIEEAGIHSGDSACALPPLTLGEDQIQTVIAHSRSLAEALGVVGLLNVQFAVKDERVYVLEANPRASRTVPFVSKVTGVALAKAAARVMVGAPLEELRAEGLLPHRRVGHEGLAHIAVKEAVMPFDRFPGVDTVLGPEMRSTGEVMGIARNFGSAFAKAELAAGVALPMKGSVFISVSNRDKRAVIFPAKRLQDLGFELLATSGTARVLSRAGVRVEVIPKVSEGPGNVTERLASGGIEMVFNTPFGKDARTDGYLIRSAAVETGVPCITTMAGMAAAVQGIEALIAGELDARSLQSYLASVPAELGAET